MWRRSKALQGVRESRLGGILARDADHLTWLHTELQAGRLKPIGPEALDAVPSDFDPRGYPHPYQVDLHHFSRKRRQNDYWVVALPHAFHLYLDEHRHLEAQLLPRFYNWALEALWRRQLRRPAEFSTWSTRALGGYLADGGDLHDVEPANEYRLRALLKEAGIL